MNYITVKEASEKWGISTRRVCVLCSKGQVTGAVKKSKVWMIPSEAKKPEDGRKTDTKNNLNPMVLLYNPNYFDNHGTLIPTKDEKNICEIQKKYLEGKLNEAGDEICRLVNKIEDSRYLFIANILKYNIAADAGRKDDYENAKRQIYLLSNMKDGYESEKLLYNIFVGWDREASVFSFLSADSYEEIMPLVSMVNAKKGINELIQGQTGSDVTNYEIICKELEGKEGPLFLAYMHLFLAVYYSAMSRQREYEFHIQRAVKILLPRKWYTPLAEYSFSIDLNFIKEADETAYRSIMQLSKNIISNYFKLGVFGALSGTPQLETYLNIRIAFKIIQGKTNEEIAEELGISQYKVKKHIEDLCIVSGATSKKEIGQFVLNFFFV